jgi:class 3 adenylate cyclase
MFCDMVGSSALSTRLDPEEQSSIIAGFHCCCANEVKSLGGMVAQYLGDGVLAYFGYPTAHENDAERAIFAGLAIIKAVGGLKAPADEPLQTRIAIGSGVVVVGDLVGRSVTQENAAIGETTNLVARLQAIAEPNTIVISPATHRLVGALFDYLDLGRHTLKGFSEPVQVRQVLARSKVESRFEAQHPSGASPLLGREEELELLWRRWEQAKRGEGRVVLVTGEPGIGKSRLTAALTEHVEAALHARSRYFCSPHHQDSAFHPVIGQLERAAGYARADGPEAKREKLAAMLTASAEEGDISLLVELLSLPGGDRFPALDLSPPAKKQRTFLALLRQLEGVSRTRPVLLIFEDLHWIDPTSREFLDLLLPRIDRLPVLVLATFRPEFQAPWIGLPHVTAITLNRLGRHDGASLVERVAGNAHTLPADVIAEIVDRTDGVPLFVEEMTKAVLEAGVALATSLPSARFGVPATLQASLMARLDRLGAEAKSVAQVGAAIGREFSHELVAAAGVLAEGPLRGALRRLVDAGLVFQRGEPPNAQYLFKHALVQDAAYGSLVRRTRQHLHARIAAALETRFPDRAAREPEALARHFSEAQQPDRAVGYWLAAGGRALQRSANREAINHLSAGLGQLEQLLDTAERTKQELELQRLLGQAYFHVKGLGAAETVRAFNRARELCAATEDDLSILPVLQGILIIEWGAAQWVKAEETSNEILLRARRTGDIGACIVADFDVAGARMFSGRPSQAWEFFDRGIASYRQIDAGTALRAAYNYSIEPGAFLYVYASWCQWLGYPDKAAALGNEAIAACERVRHAYSLSRALYSKSILHAFRREWVLVEDCATASIALAQERGLDMMVAVAGIMRAVARGTGVPGHGDAADIRRAITGYRATGTRIHLTVHLALFAHALAAGRQYNEGLAVVREALDLVEETGERMVESEIHRLRGNLLQTGNGPEEAEASYLRALDVARAQQAKSFELRAATALARLWQEQGRHIEARDLVAPVYGWFTEGFDTVDLKDAKALLAQLTA